MGVGGVAATQQFVIVCSRDVADQHDLIQCFNASDGGLLWQHLYAAKGSLDYGNSPRTTPLIDGEFVYTLGAFGDLYCLELETGFPIWHRNIAADFGSPKLTWGHSVSPIIAEGRLIVQPGGSDASLVALNPDTGEVIWQSSGSAPSYSALVACRVRGKTQIIGYDESSLGGWDLQTGQRIWKLTPPVRGDFNVPTVLPVNDQLLVSSENNGTRLYRFRDDGTIDDRPLSQNDDLCPDAHSPVLCGHRVFGIWNGLWSLDLHDGLKTVHTTDDDAFQKYGSLIASDQRVLALTGDAELILIDGVAAMPVVLSRLRLADAGAETLAHPALAGRSLFIRFGSTLARLDLPE